MPDEKISYNLDLEAVDVLDFLTSLQIRNVSVVGGKSGPQARFSCPFPGHKHMDRDTSAFMNLATTAYMCFGCGAKGNAIHFLSDYEAISPIQAARLLRERYMGGWREPEGSLWAELKNRIDKPRPNLEDLPVLPSEYLVERLVDWTKVSGVFNSGGDLPGPLRYPLERGFAPWTLETFEFGWDAKSDRLCFALRDDLGRLVGFKGRAWHVGQSPKYWVLGDDPEQSLYGFQRAEISRLVYGLNSAEVGGTGVVVEGELNVVALRQMGIANSVGIPGSYVSSDQRKLLKAYFDSLVLLFDTDDAGEAAVFGKDLEDGKRRVGAGEVLESLMPTKVCGRHDGDPASRWDAGFWQELIGSAQPHLTLALEHQGFHPETV